MRIKAKYRCKADCCERINQELMKEFGAKNILKFSAMKNFDQVEYSVLLRTSTFLDDRSLSRILVHNDALISVERIEE